MKDAVLGSKYFVSRANADHTVFPARLGSASSRQGKDPSASIGTPRCFPYHSVKPFGSLALKKTPPMPVTRSIPRLLPGETPRRRISLSIQRVLYGRHYYRFPGE